MTPLFLCGEPHLYSPMTEADWPSPAPQPGCPPGLHQQTWPLILLHIRAFARGFCYVPTQPPAFQGPASALLSQQGCPPGCAHLNHHPP